VGVLPLVVLSGAHARTQGATGPASTAHGGGPGRATAHHRSRPGPAQPVAVVPVVALVPVTGSVAVPSTATSDATTTTVAAPALVTSTPVARPAASSTTTQAPHPASPPPAPPPTPAPSNSRTGEASWYDAPSGTCASPDLAFGTVVSVTDMASGASVRCTVDDRMAQGSGRVIDLSEATFSQLADPSQGVIEVRLTW